MDDVSGIYERAQSLFDLGRLEAAEEHLGRALIQAPDDARLHLLRFEIHAARDEDDAALEAAERALELQISASTLHAGSRANRAVGRLDRARDLIDSAIDRDPERAMLHVSKALTVLDPYLADVTSGTFETRRNAAVEARAAADVAIELRPDMRNGWYARGMAAVVDSDLPAAATDLDEALRLDPEWPAAHMAMGWIRHRQGMVKLASRHYATAGRLDPHNERSIERLRGMGYAGGLTMAGATPVIGMITIFLFALGLIAAMIGAALMLAVVWTWIRFRPSRSPKLDTVGLAPEAKRVLEADLRLPRFEAG